MKIVRSIVSVIVGLAVAFCVVASLEFAGHSMFPVPKDTQEKLMNEELSRQEKWEIVKTLPTGALAAVPIAWMCGAFLGGFAAAAIAGCCKAFHAGVIGVLILAASIAMVMMIPSPDWVILIGLGTPLPLSYAAACLASRLFPPREATSA